MITVVFLYITTTVKHVKELLLNACEMTRSISGTEMKLQETVDSVYKRRSDMYPNNFQVLKSQGWICRNTWNIIRQYSYIMSKAKKNIHMI